MLPATKRKSRTFATRETDVISERKHCSRRRRHTQVEFSSSRKCADKTQTIARKRWHGARKRKRSNVMPGGHHQLTTPKAGHRSNLASLRFRVNAATERPKHTQVDFLWITQRFRTIAVFPINWERLDAGVFMPTLPATKRKSRIFATRETDVISERKHCSRRRKPRLHMAHFKRARPGIEPGSVPGPDTRLFTLSGPSTAPTRSSICGRPQFASCRACADRFSSLSTISQRYTMASLQQLRK